MKSYLNDSALIGPIVFLKSIKSVCHSQELTCFKEFFNGQFSFYATGLSDEKTKGQLKAFHSSLQVYGCTEKKAPADWFEAFGRFAGTP